MDTHTIRLTLVSTLGVALAAASGSAFAQTTYRLTDLGTLGGNSSYGFAINASGQVTGSAYTADGVEHPFLWDGTTMQDLTLGGSSGVGIAINASSQVTGQSAVGVATLLPGLGLVLAGPVAAAVPAAGAVAVAGGVMSAVANWGIPKDRIEEFETSIRNGIGVTPRSTEEAAEIKGLWQACGAAYVQPA